MMYENVSQKASSVIQKIMAEGERKYPRNDFVARKEHIRHAIVHLVKYMIWRRQKDIEHALARVAIENYKVGGEHGNHTREDTIQTKHNQI